MAAATKASRLQLSESYERAYRKLKGALPRKLLNKAAKLFIANRWATSLKFQEVAGQQGLFKYRINLRWHVVLVRKEDAGGVYYVAVDIQHHDDY